MAELKREDVFNQEVLTCQEFIDKYHPGLKKESIYYAMDNGKVDWFSMARERFVVVNDKTKEYVPNESNKRSILPLDNK